MDATLNQPVVPELRQIAHSALKGTFSGDFLGLMTGFRAYRIYTLLNELSDRELKSLNLSRQDIPRAAFDLAKQNA